MYYSQVVYIALEGVVVKGRLKPNCMLPVNTIEGRIVDDKELKMATACNLLSPTATRSAPSIWPHC